MKAPNCHKNVLTVVQCSSLASIILSSPQVRHSDHPHFVLVCGAGLVLALSLSLAPSTESFQFQGTLRSFLTDSRARPMSQLLAPCSFVAVGSGSKPAVIRSTDASVSLCAGAADFVLDSFDPEEEEDDLSCENLLKIVYSETTDQHVNDLVWKALGEETAGHAGARGDEAL